VRGITVASSIAGQLEQMLAAADADRMSFGGTGYRDSSGQWELRQRNCPDPANSPPSACRPPTARAGASMHERGLAIDFTYGGSVINSHDDPGFGWLSSNAGRFGFFNLPGEPWHWSINGQ
jgi:LAS superfamily LD-carboxypeptidase LdcB